MLGGRDTEQDRLDLDPQVHAADAIARWQAERGQTRSALLDQKDREFAQLLFVHRGKGMGLPFLNRRLIVAPVVQGASASRIARRTASTSPGGPSIRGLSESMALSPAK
jgi:hypothetical protein